jgi:transposase
VTWPQPSDVTSELELGMKRMSAYLAALPSHESRVVLLDRVISSLRAELADWERDATG